MGHNSEDGPYINCRSLTREMVSPYLEYHPGKGLLVWKRRVGRGGAVPGSWVVGLQLRFLGARRNTLGIICILQKGRLYSDRLPVRDGNVNNWSWVNICPDDWLTDSEHRAIYRAG